MSKLVLWLKTHSCQHVTVTKTTQSDHETLTYILKLNYKCSFFTLVLPLTFLVFPSLFIFIVFPSFSVFSSLLFVPSSNKHYWAHNSFGDKMELLVMEYLMFIRWFMVRDLVDYSAFLWSTPLYPRRISMELPQVK